MYGKYAYGYWKFGDGEKKCFDLFHLEDDGAMSTDSVILWKKNLKKKKSFIECDLHLEGSKNEWYRQLFSPPSLFMLLTWHCKLGFPNLGAERWIQFNSLALQLLTSVLQLRLHCF